MNRKFSPFFDLGIWPNINRRDEDVIIATYAKFGHLRMQHLIATILARAKNSPVENMDLPWVELRPSNPAGKIFAIEKQDNPRVLRTHLSAPEVYRKTGKYIYVGRDPRDLVWNLYQFHRSANEPWRSYFFTYGVSQKKTDLAFPHYWDRWINENGFPFWSYFDRLQAWWDVKAQDNVLFVHYLDFKTDMESVIREICDFLNVSISQDQLPDLINACRYDNISKVSERDKDIHSPFWNGGLMHAPETTDMDPKFGWSDYLNVGHKADLERLLEKRVGDAGRQWVLSGRRGVR